MTAETTSRTVVVGYDGSSAARAAVEYAIDRAGRDGHLVLVHAYQVSPSFGGASYYPEMLEDSSQLATTALDNLEHDCASLGHVEHTRDISNGPPAMAIARAAETHKADEIVVGSRGVGYVRALLGSVAYEVIHLANCPVIVIPARMVEPRTETPPALSIVV